MTGGQNFYQICAISKTFLVIVIFIRIPGTILTDAQESNTFDCPNTFPCFCDDNLGTLRCISKSPETLQIAFAQFKGSHRDLSNPPFIKLLELRNLDLTTLDLTSLLGLRILKLDIHSNGELTRITCNRGQGQDQGQPFIEVTSLLIQWNGQLNEAGIQTMFKCFSPNMTRLSLSGNGLTGPISPNFLPDLTSHLPNLKKLYLHSNKIQTVNPTAFQNFIQLQLLDLHMNQIKDIEGSLLPFENSQQTPENLKKPLVIDLTENKLTENSFLDKNLCKDQDCVIPGRPVILSLDKNYISRIPQDPFQDFLTNGGENYLTLNGNPIICDGQLDWLKHDRKSLESRVLGTTCSDNWALNAFNFGPNIHQQEVSRMSECPSNSSIAPCSCQVSDSGEILVFKCSGSSISPPILKNAVLTLRSSNNLTENEWLFIRTVEISNVGWTTFNLAALFKLRIVKLDIHTKGELTGFQSSTTANFQSNDYIDAQSLFIQWSPKFKADQIEKVLQYCSTNLEILGLAGNNLANAEPNNFTLQLSRFTKLTQLHLNVNRLTRLTDGMFSVPNSLRVLSFQYNNIAVVQQNPISLLSDNNSTVLAETIPLLVDLQHNRLNESSFSTETLFDAITGSRPIELNLIHNRMKSLPEAPFSSFLQSNVDNSISLGENLLVCDEKMRWLQVNASDDQGDLKDSIEEPFCSNFGGKTVFDFPLLTPSAVSEIPFSIGSSAENDGSNESDEKTIFSTTTLKPAKTTTLPFSIPTTTKAVSDFNLAPKNDTEEVNNTGNFSVKTTAIATTENVDFSLFFPTLAPKTSPFGPADPAGSGGDTDYFALVLLLLFLVSILLVSGYMYWNKFRRGRESPTCLSAPVSRFNLSRHYSRHHHDRQADQVSLNLQTI